MKKSEVSTEGISNHGLYILEREGKFVVENKMGFATYFYWPEAVFLEDLYVHPQYRKLGVGTELTDAVAEMGRLAGKKRLVCTVIPRARGSTESLKAFLAYGLIMDSSDKESVYFYKNIPELGEEKLENLEVLDEVKNG